VANAGEKQKKKYERVSALSILKQEKQFRESSLKKGEVPDVWITELEDIQVRLDAMSSGISETEFLIHALNNLTPEYNLKPNLSKAFNT
jgi:hypothetical protein